MTRPLHEVQPVGPLLLELAEDPDVTDADILEWLSTRVRPSIWSRQQMWVLDCDWAFVANGLALVDPEFGRLVDDPWAERPGMDRPAVMLGEDRGSRSPFHDDRLLVAMTGTQQEPLARLLRDRDRFVRRNALERVPHLPENVSWLMLDHDASVRAAYARRTTVRHELLTLADDHSELVRGEVAENPHAPVEARAMLRMDPVHFVRGRLAARTDDPATLAYMALNDDVIPVLQMVMENSAATSRTKETASGRVAALSEASETF